MDSANNAPPLTVSIGMVSGARHSVSEIFLYDEVQLRKAQALRVNAAGNLGGVSTGIGFWGSPEWALGGAIGLGILENLASNVAAKKGMAQLEEANQLMASAQKEGVFVPVKDIKNIAFPQPGSWRGIVKQTVRVGANSYKVSPATEVLKSYAHGGEPFILAITLAEGVICLAWDKVESFLPPLELQPNVTQLIEESSVTQLMEESYGMPQPSDTRKMEEYGITFDGERYAYGEYKYDRLPDAISYAKQQIKRSV